MKNNIILRWAVIGAIINFFYTLITLFIFPVGDCSKNDLCGLAWSFFNIHNTPVTILFDLFNIRYNIYSTEFTSSIITGFIIGLIIVLIYNITKKSNGQL